MSKEIIARIKNLQSRMNALAKPLGLEAGRDRLAKLEKQSQGENFWNDAATAQSTMQELNDLKNLLGRWDRWLQTIGDTEAALELAGEDPAFLGESEEKLGEAEQGVAALEFRRMLSGEHDRSDAYLFINSGAGGTEACDWCEMLLRMYRRWGDRHGFENHVVDFTAGETAGLKSVVLEIHGEFAFGHLKAEIGVHRLVRISPFDANQRRHTSFASVFALPILDETIEIDIRDGDLRIDTFRSGGAGGQHVNKTDSAVRITHLPSGIVVACRNDRSQHQNRANAMKLLKAKLYEAELKKKEAARQAIEKTKLKIEWGSQIRSYVLHPYKLIKDHRTDFETGKVDTVLDGDLDPFIQKFLMEYAGS